MEFALIFPDTCYHLTHFELFSCRSRLYWPSSAAPHDYSSETRSFPRYHSRTRPRQCTIDDCFLSRPLCRYVPVSRAVQRVYAQPTAHSGT